MFPGARLFRAPIWCPSGGGGTRKAGGTVAGSPIALYRVGRHQIRQGRRAARSSTSQGSAKPLWARIKGASREVSYGKADLSSRSVFLLQGPTWSGERARFTGRFLGMLGALDGWMLAGSLACFTSSRPPPPRTPVVQSSLFLYYVWP